MQGGYNIRPLVDLLDDAELAPVAAEELKNTLLMFDAFHDVAEKAKNGNAHAKGVMQTWADGEWFTNRPECRQDHCRVFKVTGETNTDDLSPAPDAWSRPDIPLHALAMLKMAPAASCRTKTASRPDEADRRNARQGLPDRLRRRRGRYRFFA